MPCFPEHFQISFFTSSRICVSAVCKDVFLISDALARAHSLPRGGDFIQLYLPFNTDIGISPSLIDHSLRLCLINSLFFQFFPGLGSFDSGADPAPGSRAFFKMEPEPNACA